MTSKDTLTARRKAAQQRAESIKKELVLEIVELAIKKDVLMSIAELEKLEKACLEDICNVCHVKKSEEI